jgi:hypothetical protein
MLTPGMTDMLTKFVERHAPPEAHADIFEALGQTPPSAKALSWLVSLELSIRLEGWDHATHCSQLGAYVRAVRLVLEDEAPEVTMTHIAMGLAELLHERDPNRYYSVWHALARLQTVRLAPGSSAPGPSRPSRAEERQWQKPSTRYRWN